MKTLRQLLMLALAGAALGGAGCATVHREDNTARLIAHPEFKTAARAAPKWVSEALQTITILEQKLQTASLP